ncbi:MAG: DUF1476 domain-containing protein [Rhodobacteraceae bacterium]|nr:DUF1476 domain-containing protein [Paracoccaceae bacterium]
MTTFDDREHAFEAQFAHDAEMTFKAEARRNKLMGLWVADILGKSGTEAEAYATEVIKADFEEAGHEDVMHKVLGDIGGRMAEDKVRTKYAELLAVAKEQLMNETRTTGPARDRK